MTHAHLLETASTTGSLVKELIHRAEQSAALGYVAESDEWLRTAVLWTKTAARHALRLLETADGHTCNAAFALSRWSGEVCPDCGYISQ